MRSIAAYDVNYAFGYAIELLRTHGVRQESQHGATLEIPEPVGVMYLNPCNRVLFDPVRDCNPFLGFFEALWIIAGRRDVKFLADIVPSMANYSDDGEHFYGAYGYRMRVHPDGDTLDGDQIRHAIARLKANPDDRQVVLVIRKAGDIFYRGKDQPCNLMVDCKIRNGGLNISVFNRSNDTIWGMMGTNVVQFSSLQEYMAGMIGCEVGIYHQITTSMHCYINAQWEKIATSSNPATHDYYLDDYFKPYPMFKDCAQFDWESDLCNFFLAYDNDFLSVEAVTPYFKEVVWPMWETLKAWKAYQKQRTPENFFKCVGAKNTIKAADWKLAVEQWLNRREQGATP